MTKLADLLSTLFDRRYGRWRGNRTGEGAMSDLTADLIGAKGELSGGNIARGILDRYQMLSDMGKLDFFKHLAQDMNLNPARVREALDAYEADSTRASYAKVLAAAEPPRQELVHRLNRVPGATGALVRMREDLLRIGHEDEALMALDLDFRHLFSSWFNRGFLVLRPINWESPAHILEKIIAYEAVHAISSWEDLRRRVEPSNRRCFAFFHPAMPDEPLIFVEVALTRGIPGSVQHLLSEGREALVDDTADTAVFYSISNCQSGLGAISFGNSLIKQVVVDLSIELPDLTTFVTLSPIPGFTRWLTAEDVPLPRPDDDAMLRALAARYPVQAKRLDGQPLDPVARFHLGNGASVHQIHANADNSEKGLAQSIGVMVNYLYDTALVSQNHERYAATQEVNMSSDVRALAASAEKAMA